MIKINNIRIEKNRLIATIKYKNKDNDVWYEVDEKYKEFLCVERADTFLVALLPFAMEKTEDIIIEGTPVTTKLYYNIVNYLMPTLYTNISKYNKINIKAKVDSSKLPNLGWNGTGVSCGVDSSYTIKKMSDANCPKELKINCLTFFNVGSHRDFGGEEAQQLFLDRRDYVKKFAEENKFEFLSVNSNISEFAKQIYEKVHTFRSASAVLAVQKLFKNYYYSSGRSVNEFKISDDSTNGNYDIYIFYLLNDNVCFYSAGCTESRLEKVREISEYKPMYNYLNVCFDTVANCGKCEKCRRTIMELYSIDKLDRYEKVFDLNYFYNNIDEYERYTMRKVFEKDDTWIEIYETLKKEGKEIKTKNKINGYIDYKINSLKNIIPNNTKKKIKKIIKRGEKDARE